MLPRAPPILPSSARCFTTLRGAARNGDHLARCRHVLASLGARARRCFPNTVRSLSSRDRSLHHSGRKTYVGDKPPSNCVVKGDYSNGPEEQTPPPRSSGPTGPSAGAEADENAFDAQALARRRRIEKDINEAADKLIAAREHLGAVEGVRPNWSYEQIQVNKHNRDRFSADESAATRRIEECRREFDRLNEEVRKHHNGSLPAGWSPTLYCRDCP